jgi:hypothetical protein
MEREKIPLAPPITVGLISDWILSKNNSIGSKIVYRDSGILHMYFYPVGNVGCTFMYLPVCDAISYKILDGFTDETNISSVPIYDGFVDLDDIDTCELSKELYGRFLLESRIIWLKELRSYGVKKTVTNKDKVPQSAYIEHYHTQLKSSKENPPPPFRMTCYLNGQLMTIWCFVQKGVFSLQKLANSPYKPMEMGCSFFRSPSEHLLRHGSRISLLTMLAAAFGGASVGAMKSYSFRRSSKKSTYALKQLSYFAEFEKLDETGKILALDASDMLIPAAIVDEGAGSVVMWVSSRTPSWWKRYAPAAVAAAAVPLLWKSDMARTAAVLASVALTADAAARTGGVRPKMERTGLKRQTKETKARLMKRSDAVIMGLIKQPPDSMRSMTPQQLRATIINAMPRTLELLFTEPKSGNAYPTKKVLERMVLYPGLLRPQLYTK